DVRAGDARERGTEVRVAEPGIPLALPARLGRAVHGAVVRVDDEAAGRVEEERVVLGWAQAAPFVFAAPARHRQPAVTSLAIGQATHELVADVAVDVRVARG